MDAATMIAKRIDDLNQNIRSLVAVYMQWFVFYWTLNSVALAWFWPKPTTTGAILLPPSLILWFFAVMAVPSAISSFSVLAAIRRMRREVATLNGHLITAANLPPGTPGLSLLHEATWPERVTAW